MRIQAIASLFLGFTVIGCASITRGTTDQVQFSSNPPEATMRTSMGHTCLTPCTIQFGRKDEFSALFSKPGFHSAEVPVRTQVGGSGAAGFAGNVLIGGLVGMGADAVTGAALDHFPNPVTVTLIPLKKGEQPQTFKITPEPPAPKPEEVSPRT